jgi:hypothetical protein
MTSSEFETKGKIEGLHNQQCGEGCDNTQAVDSEEMHRKYSQAQYYKMKVIPGRSFTGM